MPDDPLDVVLAMVEKAFMRLQAGDVVVACLEQGNLAPMHKIVEDLVLAGPQSLGVLREIQAEVGTRRSQFQDDIAGEFSKLELSLARHGIALSGLPDRHSMRGLDAAGFLSYLHQQGITDEHRQRECMRLIHEAKETMSALARQTLLLEEVELYLDDWIGGVIYQSARQMSSGSLLPGQKTRYWQ